MGKLKDAFRVGAEAVAADTQRACARGAAATAAGSPPRLIGGVRKQNPKANGTEQPEEISTDNFQFEYFSNYITDGKGKLIEIPLRRGREDGAFIDQITFTIHEDTIPKVAGFPLVSDNEHIIKYSEFLEQILGFGISAKLPFKGKFFYQSCYQLGSENVEYGKVHYGGQRETMLVELNGTGCTAAKPGWEARLYEFLNQAIRPKITRVDVAHDFFNGEYTPEQALLDHDNGHYDMSNKRPKSECKGTAWRFEDGSGKTFYIGKKGNAKFVRVYEKGRQLGDKESPWVRFEIEFRAGDIQIPLDVLHVPGQYLGGAYPICGLIFEAQAERMNATEKTVNLTFDHKLFHAKNQVGRFINFLTDICWSDKQIVDALKAEDGQYPKGLEPEKYDCEVADKTFIHVEAKAISELAIELDMLTLKTSDDFNQGKTMFPRDREYQHAKDIDCDDRLIADALK